MIQKQIAQSFELLKKVLGADVLGVYLYGSAVVGGLQKYSDIDLFVVIQRQTTLEEKKQLIAGLLDISGIYMKDTKPPIEMTIVVKSDVNPWHYPARFDFQYGEWLRAQFEDGNMEPWDSKIMPDLSLLITQVLLANKTLQGPASDQLLAQVPYHDYMQTITSDMDRLMSDLQSDTRNVLLTYARTWYTVETDCIASKPLAADWVIKRLPEKYQIVLKRAKSICLGEEPENWADIQEILKPCADYMQDQIQQQIMLRRVLEREGNISNY